MRRRFSDQDGKIISVYQSASSLRGSLATEDFYEEHQTLSFIPLPVFYCRNSGELCPNPSAPPRGAGSFADAFALSGDTHAAKKEHRRCTSCRFFRYG